MVIAVSKIRCRRVIVACIRCNYCVKSIDNYIRSEGMDIVCVGKQVRRMSRICFLVLWCRGIETENGADKGESWSRTRRKEVYIEKDRQRCGIDLAVILS